MCLLVTPMEKSKLVFMEFLFSHQWKITKGKLWNIIVTWIFVKETFWNFSVLNITQPEPPVYRGCLQIEQKHKEEGKFQNQTFFSYNVLRNKDVHNCIGGRCPDDQIYGNREPTPTLYFISIFLRLQLCSNLHMNEILSHFEIWQHKTKVYFVKLLKLVKKNN